MRFVDFSRESSNFYYYKSIVFIVVYCYLLLFIVIYCYLKLDTSFIVIIFCYSSLLRQSWLLLFLWFSLFFLLLVRDFVVATLIILQIPCQLSGLILSALKSDGYVYLVVAGLLLPTVCYL